MALLSSCASREPALVLDPVGPFAFPSADTAPTGTLCVFSAFEQGADFNSQLYRRRYSDYDILSLDGKRLRRVHNDKGTVVEAPQKVELPVCNYRVVARANGYGEVTVPVVIRANELTTVHLEGGPPGPNRSHLAATNVVRLPNGQIVGCRAGADNRSQP